MRRDLSALDRDIAQPLGRILQDAFAHGITCDLIFGGLLTGGTVQGINEVSATQNYLIGTRRVTPDGRVYRYSKSSGACWAGRGNKFILDMTAGIDFTLLGDSQDVGDLEVTFAAATHPAFTADALLGGLLLISDQDVGADQDKQVQQRVISGNDASLENAACTVRFAGGLVRAVTAATYAFCMPNPYTSIAYGSSSGTSISGVPASYVSATGKYFWLQTWGPCWLAPQDAVGKTAHSRQFVFRHDGSIDIHDPSEATAEYQQHGGFIIDNNDAANGATFVMLQISP